MNCNCSYNFLIGSVLTPTPTAKMFAKVEGSLYQEHFSNYCNRFIHKLGLRVSQLTKFAWVEAKPCIVVGEDLEKVFYESRWRNSFVNWICSLM